MRGIANLPLTDYETKCYSVTMAHAYGRGGGFILETFQQFKILFTQELKTRIDQNEFIKAQIFNASTNTNS